jgi:hypothetical protein
VTPTCNPTTQEDQEAILDTEPDPVSKKINKSWAQGLTSVILATQEVEIGRIVVSSQPKGGKKSKRPHLNQ